MVTKAEPQVFSHPDMGDRFYLFETVDLWMTDLQVAEHTHRRREGGKLLDHWSGLEGRGAGRDEARFVADTLCHHLRADVRERHRARLPAWPSCRNCPQCPDRGSPTAACPSCCIPDRTPAGPDT